MGRSRNSRRGYLGRRQRNPSATRPKKNPGNGFRCRELEAWGADTVLSCVISKRAQLHEEIVAQLQEQEVDLKKSSSNQLIDDKFDDYCTDDELDDYEFMDGKVILVR